MIGREGEASGIVLNVLTDLVIDHVVRCLIGDVHISPLTAPWVPAGGVHDLMHENPREFVRLTGLGPLEGGGELWVVPESDSVGTHCRDAIVFDDGHPAKECPEEGVIGDEVGLGAFDSVFDVHGHGHGVDCVLF